MRYHTPTEIDRRHFIEDAATMVAVLDGRLSPDELARYGSAMANAFDLLAALKECADRFEKALIQSGTDPEFAAIAVATYRALVAKAEA